jgi:hypothetical protein
MMGIIQLLLITYAVGQAGSFAVDYITFQECWTRIIIAFLIYEILQIIKHIRRITRNEYKRI